ncbi:MAG: Smr/MutS family protein [Rhodospirillum sp.]|nr:Smr/MutS family protein [Rhodospirillum sp.]MCF8491652.1 Smr/MutS family protein [Rhodospirillum sp.]MCF8501358.1 Smr/MutS family protein [Rhodospirillum sp.]
MRRRDRKLTSDEERLWREVARTVAPLRPGKATEEKEAKGDDPVKGETDRPPPGGASPARVLPTPDPKGKRLNALAELKSGHLVDMDGRTAIRLKRGRLEIDGRIDLHGMTQDSAHGALRTFIRRGHGMGWRCVLVITGKGQRAEGGIGVLRRAVPLWLNGTDLRPMILGFSPARPQHGGDGALYVMLKRKERTLP